MPKLQAKKDFCHAEMQVRKHFSHLFQLKVKRSYIDVFKIFLYSPSLCLNNSIESAHLSNDKSKGIYLDYDEIFSLQNKIEDNCINMFNVTAILLNSLGKNASNKIHFTITSDIMKKEIDCLINRWDKIIHKACAFDTESIQRGINSSSKETIPSSPLLARSLKISMTKNMIDACSVIKNIPSLLELQMICTYTSKITLI